MYSTRCKFRNNGKSGTSKTQGAIALRRTAASLPFTLMSSTAKTNDHLAGTVMGSQEFQLPVPSQRDGTPIVWIDRSLLGELCGGAGRLGPESVGSLMGHWDASRAGAVITGWSSFNQERSVAVHEGRGMNGVPFRPDAVAARQPVTTPGLIGIWCAASAGEAPPPWPRDWHRSLTRKFGFSASAAMLQLVLEKGHIWRPKLWLWGRRRGLVPRALTRPGVVDIRLGAGPKRG